jgi:redox-sensitive bicupin YhaK (pirin superfamily)
MTAGRGIVHSEMPEQEDGLLRGFQLWVNLPASDKMTAPRYQDIPPEDIPVVERPDGVRVKLIAGTLDGVSGPVEGIATAPIYLDVALPAGAAFDYDLPAEHTAFVYVYEGAARVGGDAVARGQLAVLGPGARAAFAAGDDDARLLLVAGRPLHEPVVRYGPFVMNTEAEIAAAIEDFQAGRL